jgi:GNAT superfamily N-acetyltransferase
VSAARVIPAAMVGDPLRLASLVARVFGEGDRPAGWFARKLARERVDLALSQLAIDGDAEDPGAWLGYVLVGAPPSLGGRARTGGTGVIPTARGRGIGSMLLSAARAAARARGISALQIVAEHGRQGFYEKAGFVPVRGWDNVLAFARGGAAAPAPAARGWHEVVGSERAAWSPEAWEVAHEAATWSSPDATIHASREGTATILHRLCARDDASARAAVATLLDRLPAATPVVVPGVDPVSSITQMLSMLGFVTVQRATLMEVTLLDLDNVDALPP